MEAVGRGTKAVILSDRAVGPNQAPGPRWPRTLSRSFYPLSLRNAAAVEKGRAWV